MESKRIIKFRAWLKRRLDVFEPIFKPQMYNLNWLEIGTVDNLVNNYDFELMQFTGLLDKNGKEIYEGDWIKFVAHTENGNRQKMQGSIWFDEGNSCFQIIAEHNEIGLGRNSKEMFLSWAKNIEVIGNIYEGLHSGENVDGK